MMATIKVYAYYSVKIYKYNSPENSKHGGAGAPVLDPPLHV